ncbi:restriction endonuclease subunit S [Alicyclobacillus sp. SP_1]|uniref:restriction endonuclease subunit S n=1 Tax=Alicyclobacillus sp. SP_1 TaxID=2942475 RepID=UPI00215773E1|nr:restriction endonuclease subunit S [Alicyclobacillus sp. SP_1]
MSNNIPPKWKLSPIEEVARTTSGGTPSRSNPAFYTDGTIPWIKTGELGRKFVSQTEEKITEEALKKSSAKLLPPKTVLVAMYGATIGKVAITAMEAATNQACCAIIPNEWQLDYEYLYYVLQHNERALVELGAGGAQPNISQQLVKRFSILLPTFDEQRKIATILTSVDDAIDATQRIIDHTEVVKRGLMQQLFTKGVGHKTFKQTEIGEIPAEWDVLTIGECCDILDNKRVPLSQKERETMHGDIPYYGATKVVDYIDKWLFDEDIVLIGEDGDHFKKFRSWSMTSLVRGKSWVNNHAHVMRAKSMVTNDWVYRFLEHRDITPFLAIQGATRLKLTQDSLRRIPVAIPPIEEQNRITKTVSSIATRIAGEKKCLEQLKQTKQGLMQVLLTGKVRVNVDEPSEVSV